jgi:hypothetical protein
MPHKHHSRIAQAPPNARIIRGDVAFEDLARRSQWQAPHSKEIFESDGQAAHQRRRFPAVEGTRTGQTLRCLLGRFKRHLRVYANPRVDIAVCISTASQACVEQFTRM